MNDNNINYPKIIYNDKINNLSSLTDYLLTNLENIQKSLSKNGAILFRGFPIKSILDFNVITESLSSNIMSYVGGDSPRTKLTNNVYTSTEYPSDQEISMHHEMSFSNYYPRFINFFCDIKPIVGGYTPIADGRKIYEQLPENIISKFYNKKLKYIMNLNNGDSFGKSWQDTFEMNSVDDLEKHLSDRKISYYWKNNGQMLRLYEIVQPILTHPITQQKVFFSQADQWHPSNLGEELYKNLLELMPVEDFYHNCTYGDDSEIDINDLNIIRKIVNKNRVYFKWERGDLLMLDNLISMHGRSTFEGDRRILVSMY